MTTSIPTPPLSLEEVAKVFLLCFEAAADAVRPTKVAYVKLYHEPAISVPVWWVWTTESLHNEPPEDPLSFSWPPADIIDALTRKDMCDWFCWLIEAELRKKVGELFGASVGWLSFWPRIDFLLACKNLPNQLDLPPHSVLVIEKQDGSQLIMDGTLRQYLWAESSWLQSSTTFIATRLDATVPTMPSLWFADDEKRAETEDASGKIDGGFWAIAHQKMTELCAELDWEELRSLGGADRDEHVKNMAKEKFACIQQETL